MDNSKSSDNDSGSPPEKNLSATKGIKIDDAVMILNRGDNTPPWDEESAKKIEPINESTLTAKTNSIVGGESPQLCESDDPFRQHLERLAICDLQNFKLVSEQAEKAKITTSSSTLTANSPVVTTTTCSMKTKREIQVQSNQNTGKGALMIPPTIIAKAKALKKQQKRKELRKKREEELKRLQTAQKTVTKLAAQEKRKKKRKTVTEMQRKRMTGGIADSVQQLYFNGFSSTPTKMVMAGKNKSRKKKDCKRVITLKNGNNNGGIFSSHCRATTSTTGVAIGNNQSSFSNDQAYPSLSSQGFFGRRNELYHELDKAPVQDRGSGVEEEKADCRLMSDPSSPLHTPPSQQEPVNRCCRSPNVCPGYDEPVYQTPNIQQQQAPQQAFVSRPNPVLWNPSLHNYPAAPLPQAQFVTQNAPVPLGFGLQPPAFYWQEPPPLYQSPYVSRFYGGPNFSVNYGNSGGSGFYNGYSNFNNSSGSNNYYGYRGEGGGYSNSHFNNTVNFRPSQIQQIQPPSQQQPPSLFTFLANTWLNSGSNSNGTSSNQHYVPRPAPAHQQQITTSTITNLLNDSSLMANGLAGVLPSSHTTVAADSTGPGNAVSLYQGPHMQAPYRTPPPTYQQPVQPSLAPNSSAYFSNLQY